MPAVLKEEQEARMAGVGQWEQGDDGWVDGGPSPRGNGPGNGCHPGL